MIGMHCALGTVLSTLGHQAGATTVTYAGQREPSVGTVALNTDISVIATYYRGRRMQVELLNYNVDRPVELVSIAVAATILDHKGD